MANVRSLNRVILCGRLGKDPEIRTIPSNGQSVASFSLATSDGYMDKANNWQESTEWHNVVAWGYTAKKVEKSLSKGSLTMVEGKIRTRKWQDKSGQDHYTTEIIADSITPLEKRQVSNPDYSSQSQYPNHPQQDANYYQPQNIPEMQIEDDSFGNSGGEPF